MIKTAFYAGRRIGILPFLIVVLILTAVGGAFTQESDISDEEMDLFSADEDDLFGTTEDDLFGGSEDDMFGGDSLVEEITEENTLTGLASEFLVSESTVIGGRFSFSIGSDITENDGVWDESFDANLGAQIYVDARPDEDFRFFTKATIDYPFITDQSVVFIDFNQDGVIDQPGDSLLLTGKDFDDVIYIKEMFSDFNWNDTIFFRVGKQTAEWGVGYFYSPADIINITEIDPTDPEAELEGPLLVKAHMPFGINNVYLYLIADGVESIADVAVAPRAEFVLGGSEVGFGVYYKYDTPPRVMTTISTSIGDWSLFGEAVGAYGSDKTFVRETGPGVYDTYDRDDELFFSGTAGFSNSWSDDFGYYNFSLTGQYLYNGEGYGDYSVLTDLIEDFKSNPLSLANPLATRSLLMSDTMNMDVHSMALTGSWRSMFDSDFSLSILTLNGFSQKAGQIIPSLSWNIMDYAGLTLKVPVSYDYSGSGTEWGASFAIDLSLGGGTF
jgi:hypothetical protein